MAPFEPVLSDDELTSILLSDARQASKNYASQGLSAYLPASKRPTSKIKPNTRFLQNLVRNADGHNERLRRKEETERKEKLRVLEREAKKREGRLVTFSDDEAEGPETSGDREGDEEGDARRRKRRKTDEHDEERERRRHKSSKHSRGRESERRRRKRRRNTSSAEESDGRSRSRSRSRESRHHRKHRSKRDHSNSGSEEEHKHESRSHRKERQRRDDESASGDDKESHSKSDKKQSRRSKHEESSIHPPKPTSSAKPNTPHDMNGNNNIKDQLGPAQRADEDDWSLSLSALRERANHARIQAAKNITANAHIKGSDSNIKWTKQGEEREWDRGKEVEVEGLHTRFEDD
jgi:hypothetical protein